MTSRAARGFLLSSLAAFVAAATLLVPAGAVSAQAPPKDDKFDWAVQPKAEPDVVKEKEQVTIEVEVWVLNPKAKKPVWRKVNGAKVKVTITWPDGTEKDFTTNSFTASKHTVPAKMKHGQAKVVAEIVRGVPKEAIGKNGRTVFWVGERPPDDR